MVLLLSAVLVWFVCVCACVYIYIYMVLECTEVANDSAGTLRSARSAGRFVCVWMYQTVSIGGLWRFTEAYAACITRCSKQHRLLMAGGICTLTWLVSVPYVSGVERW